MTDNPLLPFEVAIEEVRRETPDTVTYTLGLKQRATGQPYKFQPGQFNMVSLFGIGEAAVSLSSDPIESGSIQHTVRAVGNVTNALARLQAGSTVHLRGPYGHGWPLEGARGQDRDLLIVAGGVGLPPLRPVVLSILRERKAYGRVTLLYGARTPADLVYTREFDAWQRGGIQVLLTVDRVPEGQSWAHNVGVVPTLFEQLALAPERSVAFVCGPELMMRFAVLELARRGLDPGQIYVSLERRMECGFAMCGRCQVGPVYVCQDGPVFSYAALKALPIAVL